MCYLGYGIYLYLVSCILEFAGNLTILPTFRYIENNMISKSSWQYYYYYYADPNCLGGFNASLN